MQDSLNDANFRSPDSPPHPNTAAQEDRVRDLEQQLWDLKRLHDREMEQRGLAEMSLKDYGAALEMLNQTSIKLVAEHDLKNIVQAVTDGGREISKAAFGAFFYNTTNEQGDSFMLYTLSGAPPEAFANMPMPRKTAMFAHTFEGKGVRRVDDVLKYPQYGKSPPHYGMPPGHLPVRSYLSVPVVSRTGGVLGGLFYGHPDPGVFTERAERLVVNLAAQAAVAIDNADLYKALQEELKQRKAGEADAQKFAAIVNSSNDAIISKDLNAIIMSWNRGAERIFGYTAEEAIGRSITILIPPNHINEEPQILERIRRGETINHYETVRRRKDGSNIDISLTVSPVYDGNGNIVGASKIVRDITQVKETEEQLRQALKMEAVGRLAGGIAHDFNNLLTSIGGFTEMALARAKGDPVLKDYLEEVLKSSRRAASLTQQLLAYSRKQILAPKIIDLNATVSELDKMLPRLIGEDIRFRTQLDPALCSIKADPSQIQQIIVNLVLNARDAMPNGGTLDLRTSIIRLDSENAPKDLADAPGPYALLEVRDSGVGMPPEVQKRVFEPFFTTKEVGKGTGLGLSSAYGIVKQSNGAILVDSAPGKGTTFTIYLPCVDGQGIKIPALPIAEASPRTLDGETILLAEDENSVRKFLAFTLRAKGYNVVEAADGELALEAGRKLPKIDLLLSDVVMPNMNGGKLAEGIKALHPDIKVLFMSGYTKEILRPGGGGSDFRFLQKPFTQAELLAKIRDLLRKPSP
jgi:PAS domain S-box-containing protein